MARWEVFGEARYRTVDEARTIETMLFNGWCFELAAGQRAAAAAEARAVLDRCVALGLPYRRSIDGGRLFDPVETQNFLKWAQIRLGEPMWEEHNVATGRWQAWEAFAGPADLARPPALETLGPQRYAVTIRRTFNLERWRPGDRVRLRLPTPIEDSAHRDVSLAFLPPEGVAVETALAPGRLDALVAGPESGQVSLGVRASFTACPNVPSDASGLDPAEAALYTRPNEGLIKVSERVRALAAELAGRDTDTLAVVRRFWTFMLDELATGPIHYDALDPARPLDTVLETGWCDCQAGSALLAALCRARQIPARLVSGYMLHVAGPGHHTWMEAWVEGCGWLPFDLTCWDLSAGGRDAAWRDFHFGCIDHRMVTDRPPRLFGGAGAVRLPAAWRLLIAQTDRGSTLTFEDLDTGALVYGEEIEVALAEPVAR